MAEMFAEHAADEAVHHVQRRDVDQHSFGMRPGDPLGQIVLQRHDHPVFKIDLDGQQQAVADLEDRDAVGFKEVGHGCGCRSARVSGLGGGEGDAGALQRMGEGALQSALVATWGAPRRDARWSALSAGGCR